MLIFKFEFFKSNVNKTISAGFLVTSIFYYLYGSPFTLFVAVISFLLLYGLHTSIPIRNLTYALPSAFLNYFSGIGDFFNSLLSPKGQKKKHLKIFRLLRIIAFPFFLILFFLMLYSIGSSYFSDAVDTFFVAFEEVIKSIGNYIDFIAILLGVLGVVLRVIHSLNPKENSFSDIEKKGNDILKRSRKKGVRRFRAMDLSVELKSAVFLFASLSFMLMIVLFLEAKNIWIDFEWGEELLKEMVREGTYVLIFSILLSMAISLYYFRGNINFHPKNKLLRILANIWLSLNGLMVISVFIRNYYYISYFGLAYKRIGVLFFLLLCLVGLYTMFIKINKVKSTFYVSKVNSLAAYLTLVLICSVNWDVVIAKYNLENYNHSFVHLPYMAELSDKALPYLVLSDKQIEEIESKQVENIPFVKRGYFDEVGYKDRIERRINQFKSSYADRHWLERTWAEDQAYKKLVD